MTLPTPDALQIALTATTLAAVWIGWAKIVGPRLRRGWDRVVGTFQAIAGRDAIIDKVSGKEVSPAVPPLGEQLSTINDTMSKLVAVIESNHDAHVRLDNHEGRISELEAARLERLVSQAESAHMWRAVADNAANDTD